MKKMDSCQRKVFILGASGFIGRTLFEKFTSLGTFETRGFSSKECDLLSFSVVKEKLSDLTKKDVLIMASCITRLTENSFDAFIRNVQMAENVAKLLVVRPAAQVIFLSTVDVYGIHLKNGTRISEKIKLDPNDYYAISKVASEFLLKRTCERMDVPLAIFRLSGVYGPNDAGKSTISALFNSAFRDKTVHLTGGGRDMRDYVYVGDIYNIIEAAIEKRKNATMNVATGRSQSLLEIVKLIQSQLSWPVKIKFIKGPIHREQRIKDMLFDCSLLKKEFPRLKLTNLKAGISSYLTHSLKKVNDV